MKRLVWLVGVVVVFAYLGALPTMAQRVRPADEVEARIAQGADVNAKDSAGRTPLMWAAYHGHADEVEALIAKGADVNVKDNEGGTPLLWAAVHGHTDVVELLIAKGADVNAKDSAGQTPLMLADREGHTDVVKLLIAKEEKEVNSVKKQVVEGIKGKK